MENHKNDSLDNPVNYKDYNDGGIDACKNVNHDKYLEKSISVGICQPPSRPLSGDRTSIDPLRLKADVGHYLDTARYTEGLEREARQRVLKAV